MKYLEIYIALPVSGTFTYSVKRNEKIDCGYRVLVEFGRKKVRGFIKEVHYNKPNSFDVKEIIEVLDDNPIFDISLIELCEIIAFDYIGSVGEILSLALPTGIKESTRYKIPFNKKDVKEIELNDEQIIVKNDILLASNNGKKQHLIFGITGSGKTEVYIMLAKEMLAQNKSVLYLVPEISLSSQIFERLYNVFGDELIVYHSKIATNQKFYSWKKFQRGESRIVVGTRSSIFMQCDNLGLIIIDEEHDNSYKENSSPRYSAKRVAFYRSKRENALLILGSATPSIESLYAAENGQIGLHKLNGRFGDAKIPKIEIVKFSPSKKNVLSPKLKLNVNNAVSNKNQAIILLNRRGYSPFVICEECNKTIDCPYCNISMNYHKGDNLLCHYCGYKMDLPIKCDSCGSSNFVKVGSGTQRVEELISMEFPNFNVFRLDQDSSRSKTKSIDLIEKMNDGEIDVLLGTQMVSKGFDFKNVTVVGVLMADIGLNMPDFRASERIFSLLLQVSGRAGRGASPGKVVIQTLDDENNFFKNLIKMDYYSFYKEELSMRKMLSYPPFSRLARILVRGKNEEKVISIIEKLKNKIDEIVNTDNLEIEVLGPSEAPFVKIASNYRYHIILRSKRIDVIRNVILKSKNIVKGKDLYLEIDIDPYDML